MKKLLAILCALCLMLGSASAQSADGGQAPEGTPPAMGDGQTPPDGQAPPDKPDGEAPMDNGNGTPPDKPDGTQAGPGGGGMSFSQGTAAMTIDTDSAVGGESYSSESADDNALRVTGTVTVSLDGITVSKTGGTEDTDSCNFYGQNAGMLATDGAQVTITDAQVTTDGSGANGVFSYGEGTTVNISDSTISTSSDNSGGILVTGGGELNASNLSIETQGASAAAIRSDRGGGTMTVNGGTYTSNGTGSPAVYSTAAISVSNATLTANASEAVVVEGKNSVALTDCEVSGSMQGTYGGDSAENIHNVMLYQSMSGDADVGRSDFSMTGGSLTALNGDMFYITNTSCSIELSNVALTYANDQLLTVAGNDGSRGWGTVGSNGGDCLMSTDAQSMEGTITVDAISTLNLTMSNGSSFTGTINPDGQAGEVDVTLDDTSVWSLTADAYITSLSGSADQVITNGYELHIANE